MSQHSARLNALAAALCALLLLVALGVMDANRAPWWALLAVQGALLVNTASAGIWLDRAAGERRRGDEAMRGGPADPLWWANLERKQNGSRCRMRAGSTLPGDDDDVFWQERTGNQKEDRT